MGSKYQFCSVFSLKGKNLKVWQNAYSFLGLKDIQFATFILQLLKSNTYQINGRKLIMCFSATDDDQGADYVLMSSPHLVVDFTLKLQCVRGGGTSPLVGPGYQVPSIDYSPYKI